MTRGTIDVEMNEEGVGLYWSTPGELRTALAVIGGVVRSLEQKREAGIALRAQDAEVLCDAFTVTDDEIRDLRPRIVDANVAIDGAASAYQVRTDGHRLIVLDVPAERRGRLWAAFDEVVSAHRREGAKFFCPWETRA